MKVWLKIPKENAPIYIKDKAFWELNKSFRLHDIHGLKINYMIVMI